MTKIPEEVEMSEDVAEADEDMEEGSSSSEGEENDETNNEPPKAFLPGQRINPDEELVVDDQAYIVYHQANLGSPCLSFDIIPENDVGAEFPLQAYGVAGTQAAKANHNNIVVFKMFNLHAIKRRAAKKSDEDEDSSSDEEEETADSEKAPKLKMAAIKHVGCINRIRFKTLGSASVVAAWSETGSVGIWSLDEALQKVEECRNFSITAPAAADAASAQVVPRDLSAAPLFSFKGHPTEGFALDWCPTATGVLATGDCQKNIHVWKPADSSATWMVDQMPLVGHTDSVEDIQWSPNEQNVLASCSVDKSIRIWDCRARADKACMLTVSKAHDADVNVISWNGNEPFIASGGDEGHLKIWDLRTLDKGQPVAVFKHHRGPVTSVDWHKTDSTVLASSGEDNQVALWDLAVEKDDEAEAEEMDPRLNDLPPQLLFIHQGLEDVKEVHWHPKIPGLVLATSQSGFDVFKTISV